MKLSEMITPSYLEEHSCQFSLKSDKVEILAVLDLFRALASFKVVFSIHHITTSLTEGFDWVTTKFSTQYVKKWERKSQIPDFTA